MSPEPSKENDRNAAWVSQDQRAERVDPADTGPQRLDLNYPQVLALNGVSSETVNFLLKELMPEIADVASDYLYDVVQNNHTVSAARLKEMYFQNTPFTINQTRAFTVGVGSACESSHTVMIVPYGKDDSCMVQLQRSVTDPSAINLSFLFTWTALEERWGLVNLIGSVMGRDDLLGLFVRAPAEQIEEYESGLRITKLTPVISVNTLPPERSGPSQDQSEIVEDTPKRSASWVPTAMYCSLPVYSEERAILKIIAPKHHDAIIASGLLRVADNFTRNQAEIHAERLQAISQKLPIPLFVEFKKHIEIGEFEETDEDESDQNSVDSEEDTSGRDVDEAAEAQEPETREPGSSYSTAEEIPADEEGQEHVHRFDSDADVSYEEQIGDPSDGEDGSVVGISGLQSNEGALSLYYRSSAELRGGAVLRTGATFNSDAQVFGVEFESRAKQLSSKQIAHRWRLASRIGAIVGSVVDPYDIQMSLDLARSSDGKRFGVDVLAHRLAMYVTK